MTDPVSAAYSYDASLVPTLMEEWAPRVASAAQIEHGDHVLDVACGTGVLTREVARRVGPVGSVIGLDLDPGMVAVARAKHPDLQWNVGDAERLPFADGSFDAVVSQFGLMFVPNKPRALAEMWRILKPGGQMAIAVWASLEETPAYAAETELIERLGGPAVTVPLREPFGLGHRDEFARHFADAGIPLESLTTIEGTGSFPSIREMVAADVLGWLPVMGVTLAPSIVEAILTEAEQVLAPYQRLDGSVRFASPAHIAVAVCPTLPTRAI